MQEDAKTGRLKLSFEELAYSNMMVMEALVELLTEKGLLTHDEITERVNRLKATTRVSFLPLV